jgi:putative methyltransferase (TIGR04325 family)
MPVVGAFMRWDYSRFFARCPPNRFRGVYPDFGSAEASVPPGRRVGYDYDELAGLYRLRMDKACESDYAMLFWMRDLIRDGSFVFDFGGHVGVSYYGWRNYLHYPDSLRWLVHEVPAIVRGGQALALERGASHLKFTSALPDGRDCTVFMAAGSLQYVDRTLAQILDEAGCRPAHLLINKMPLYEGETFVTVQSTGRAFHAYRIQNREEFVEGVKALGYRVVDDWMNREQHCEIPFSRDRDIPAYSGYYFQRC